MLILQSLSTLCQSTSKYLSVGIGGYEGKMIMVTLFHIIENFWSEKFDAVDNIDNEPALPCTTVMHRSSGSISILSTLSKIAIFNIVIS